LDFLDIFVKFLLNFGKKIFVVSEFI